MLVDFRRTYPSINYTNNYDTDIDVLTEYKYVQTIVDNKLSFECNTVMLY